MAELPPIADIAEASRRSGLAVDASELHGALCGWLAGGGDPPSRAGSPRCLADDALPAPGAGLPLDRLRGPRPRSWPTAASSSNCCCPMPRRRSIDRSGALFDWCRGFVGAFGLAAGSAPAAVGREPRGAGRPRHAWPPRSRRTSGDEEDEEALVEIEEFVRVAALLLHGDCVLAPRASPAA